MPQLIKRFDSPSEFLFDTTKFDISGGKGFLKDLRPANCVFYVSYNTGIDANWGNGTLTGTAFGGFSISAAVKKYGAASGDCAHGDLRGANYNINNLLTVKQKGTIEFWLLPNYSGNPASRQFFFAIGKSGAANNNLITMYHHTDGHLYLLMKDYMDQFIYNGEDLGLFNPTALVPYRITIAFDLTEGFTDIYINNFLFNTGLNIVAVRDANFDTVKIGSDISETFTSNFYIDEFAIYDAKVRQGVFFDIPDVELPQTVYPIADVVLQQQPVMTVKTMSDIALTIDAIGGGGNGIGIIVNVDGVDKWYNSVTPAWETSDGSYLQSNTVAQINANLATLLTAPPERFTVYFKIIVHNAVSNTQTTIDNFIINYVFAAADIPLVDHIPVFSESDDFSGEITGIKMVVIPDRKDKVEQLKSGISYIPKQREFTNTTTGYLQVDQPRSNDFLQTMTYTVKIIQIATMTEPEKLLAEYKGLIIPDTATVEEGVKLSDLVKAVI